MKSVSVGPLATWIHPAANNKPLARVLLIHGLSEHSARHLNTVNALTALNLEVVRFDLRGAGESGGERQWIESFEDYVSDTVNIFNYTCSNLPPLPLFVLGHSLGGAIAVYFCSRYAKLLQGMVLSAPAFQVGEGISPLKIAVGKKLVKVFPRMKMPKSTDARAVSRDPEVVEAYMNDPLCVGYNTLNQGNEILNALEKIPDLVPQLKLPVAIYHGTADQLIRPEGSFYMVRLIPYPDKQLSYLPGGYHEPHNDIDQDKYFALLAQWFTRQLDGLRVPKTASGRSSTSKRSPPRQSTEG